MNYVKYKLKWYIKATYEERNVAKKMGTWNGDLKLWELNGAYYDKIKDNEIKWIDNYKNSVKTSNEKIYNSKLFPFQNVGVEFIDDNDFVLLADEMGLGKTIQAIEIFNQMKQFPVIIVCPAVLKLNWEKEIKKFINFDVVIEVLKGRTKIELPKADIYIINYDIIEFWVDVLLKTNPKIFVADESHYIKNKSTRRFKAIKKLINSKKSNSFVKKIFISGTPVLNKPKELISLLQLYDNKLFRPEWYYMMRFCAGKKRAIYVRGGGRKQIWDFDGASNTHILNIILRMLIMVRRKKEDVLKQLPNKQRSYIYFENKAKADDEFDELFTGRYDEVKGEAMSLIAEISKQRQLAVEQRFESSTKFIDNILETKNKVVIFCYHKDVVKQLVNYYKKLNPVFITGDVSIKRRNENVEKFQNKKNCRLFIATIRSCGVGITLTASDTVIFMEYDWTASQLLQAEDRVHRIGQKESVNIYYLVLNNSVEITISQLVEKKFKLEKSILEGVKFGKTQNMFEEFYKIYSKKKALNGNIKPTKKKSKKKLDKSLSEQYNHIINNNKEGN